MNSKKERMVFAELVLHALQGDISEEQCGTLRQILETDSQAVYLYADLIEIYTELSHYGSVCIADKNLPIDSSQVDNLNCLMKFLAQDEEKAPIVVVKKEAEIKPLLEKLERPVLLRKINKPFLWTTLISTAAFLAVIACLMILPAFNPVPVAILQDSIHAEFAADTFVSGNPLTNRKELYVLREGIVSLKFDSGAEVVIEAPAEFQLKSPDKMILLSGRLYAEVPKQAIGFVVDTLDVSVIDLGTEFGVFAVPMQGTELHVFRGKTQLLRPDSGNEEAVLNVTTGQAHRYETATGNTLSIAVGENSFVRKIDSNTSLIWKGQRVISLTDLVMGGNGFGTSQETYIPYDPKTGHRLPFRTGEYRSLDVPYQRIPDNPYLDGVFVPKGPDQVVSSAGHVFTDCPKTTGQYHTDLSFEKYWDFSPAVAEQYRQARPAELCPGLIFIHSNLGATFDLNMVRRRFAGMMTVHRFLATVGTVCSLGQLPFEGATDLATNNTDFDVWLVVDGQLRFKAEKVRWDSLVDLDVPLQPGDRFLSILVTDGGTVTSGENANHYDLCGIADPRFEMELTD